MPRYFLDLEQGLECVIDVEGCLATDDSSVLKAVHEVLADYNEDLAAERTRRGEWTMSISDQSGRLVARVPV